MIKNIKLALFGALALAAAFAVGRYTVPTKTVTKIEEKIVEKEVIKWKEKEVKNEDKDVETVIVETTYPDGTVKKETRIIDKGKIKVTFEAEGSSESEKSKVTSILKSEVKENANWNVSLLAGSENLKYNEFIYGVHVQKTVLGPFSVGAFGLTNKTVGLSIGGTF